MPLYEFRCPSGHEFEKFYRSIGTAAGEEPCPNCGSTAARMMSTTGLVFKGSGFYITDYGKDGKKDERDAAAATKSAAETKARAAEEKKTAAAESKPASGDAAAPAAAAPAASAPAAPTSSAPAKPAASAPAPAPKPAPAAKRGE